jgi:glycosyltransferase involved in cell wall biosynthesis
VVAGEGPDRDCIRASIESRQLEGNVEMRGAVDHTTKQALLATCDAVVMPNIPVAGDVEGFGLVALEAGAAGKLTFAADLEGLRDAVRNGENGWRLTAGDAAAWIDALDRALSDRGALSAAGQRALQCVRTDYNWASVGRAFANNVGDFARR